MINLDANATAPLCTAARNAWLDAAERFPGNPSSQHRLGARADAAIERAREETASSLGCHADQIIWTSGATEAANLLLHHLAAAQSRPAEIWISSLEHPCITAAVTRSWTGQVRRIPATPQGCVDLHQLQEMLNSSRPAVIVVMAANNETGVLQPWREILEMCGSRQIPFATDVTQWLGRIKAQGLGHCDYVLGSGHKMGGPKGVGFLKIPGAGLAQSLVVGGPQESGRRAGTENVPSIIGFAAALADREARISGHEHNLLNARRIEFEQRLPELVPGCEIMGTGAPRLWNTTMVVMPPLADCHQRWVVKLDRLGIAVSSGSACSSGREKLSPVLEAMGISPDRSPHALRVSCSWENKPEDWGHLESALASVLAGAVRREDSSDSAL